MITAVVGIDIAKQSFDAVLLYRNRTKHRSFANSSQGFTQLRSWLAKMQVDQVHACMEATGTYWEALALDLHQAGHIVSVVNPNRIAGFANSQLVRSKTDKLSATVIAQFCQALQPDAWVPPAVELRDLQALVRRLSALKEMRLQEGNRLDALVELSVVTESIQAHLQYLDQAIAQTEQQLREHIHRHPGLKARQDLLLSIPGIGEITAAALMSELQHFNLYENARQVAAYAGLVPRHHRSGTSVFKRPRLSKTGNARLRRALYMPAITAQRYNPIISAFCQQLLDRGKPKMAVLAAAMRKLLHLVFGVLKSGRPFDPSYATTIS